MNSGGSWWGMFRVFCLVILFSCGLLRVFCFRGLGICLLGCFLVVCSCCVVLVLVGS